MRKPKSLQAAKLSPQDEAFLEIGRHYTTLATFPAGQTLKEPEPPGSEESADEEDFAFEDIAEQLEWVAPQWRNSLAAFIESHCGAQSAAKFFDLYDAYNYNHAVEILVASYPNELIELIELLLSFRIRMSWIRKGGGNESAVPQAIQAKLYPRGWHETRLKGDLVYSELRSEKQQATKKGVPVTNKAGFPKWTANAIVAPTVRRDILDAHKIDHVKNRVAFDMEWNSKDQTFDRDLYAMRLFHEAHLISAGVVLTRSGDLTKIFRLMDPYEPKIDGKKFSNKYGSSTTWMGKLLYRLRSSRSGGCPVLALGIRQTCIEDWNEYAEKHGINYAI